MEDTPYHNNDDVSADELEAQEGVDYKLGVEHYRKALVAFIGMAVTVMAVYGIDLDPEVVATFTTFATAVLVFLVPNK